jgi:hypothetical protein
MDHPVTRTGPWFGDLRRLTGRESQRPESDWRWSIDKA